MAIPSTSAVSVISTGNDANAGIFDTAATFATNGTATSANTASPVVASATYNFVAGDVGAWYFEKSGTGTIPGWYQIQSVALNAATLNAAVGAAVLYGQAATATAINQTAGIATIASPTSITWGVDYSLQTSPQVTFTDIVIGATTTQFTSAAFPVGPNYVGNGINVTSGGSATVQRVTVASTSTITATCNVSLGTASSGVNAKLGGAVATIGTANGFATVAGNLVWFKGSFAPTGTTITQPNSVAWVGYTSLRTDGGQVTVDASGMTAANNCFTLGGPGVIKNFIVTTAQAIAFNGTSSSTCTNCKATGSLSDAFKFGVHFNCWASAPAGNGFNSSLNCYACLASGATGASGNGFSLNPGAPGVKCIAYGCSQIGFTVTSNCSTYYSCVAYGNAGAGFREPSNVGQTWVNCIAYGNTGVGFSWSSAVNQGHGIILHCFSGGNSAHTTNGNGLLDDAITALTADPFTNAAGLDFTLNTTAGGGAVVRAAGFDSILGTAASGYLDGGAFQHQDSGGGSGPVPSIGSPFLKGAA